MYLRTLSLSVELASCGHYLMDLGVELAVALCQVVHLVLLSLQIIEGFLEGKIHMCVPQCTQEQLVRPGFLPSLLS